MYEFRSCESENTTRSVETDRVVFSLSLERNWPCRVPTPVEVKARHGPFCSCVSENATQSGSCSMAVFPVSLPPFLEI